ncbi:MAG: signal peptidase II [Nitrospirae bacterium]|nr:signal peptidase II [Nitrospirota bacterium]
MKKNILLAIVPSIVILLDYFTKQLIVSNFSLTDSYLLLPFIKIVHVQNPGAAFGILKYLGNNVFIFFSIVAIICILIYKSKIPIGLEFFSLSLILGGAIGNLIDRITKGKVIDFIDFFVGDWHWPAFNIADSALTVGMILFIWANLREMKRQKTRHN